MVMSGVKSCNHSISVKLRSGACFMNVKPIYSYDSQYIIVACGLEVRVFGIKSGECFQSLKYHSRPVISIRGNKNNNLQIFSCSDDGVVVRWDYMDGKILQVYNLQMNVTNFYISKPNGPWFISKKFENQHRLYSLKLKGKAISNMEMILKPVSHKENTLDFGFMDKYVASVLENTLTIYNFDSKSIIRHKTGDRLLTCVVCHPSEFVLATGDNHGRIILWSNALTSNHPIRSIYHWHTLPVSDLAFSPEGSYLHSGGGEAALVKWSLFSEERSILPRMGAPILHIAASTNNFYVLTVHSDNVLQVINSQRSIIQVIQGVTQSHSQISSVNLLYNAYLKALVMNGKPGYLQFYDIKQDKQLFHLDIVSKNFLSQERETTIINMDVQRAALDESGLWLATAEYWSSEDSSPQIWLKFWMFDLQKQLFVLNTNVILPHNKELNCILFQPQVNQSKFLSRAVTTSSDGRFKIWTLNENPNESKQCWSCDSMGCYRDFPAGSASFSEEGSLLAVAFESVATLWNVEGTALKAVLCHDKNKRNIRQLLFSRYSSCHYLMCHDSLSLTVWNVLTLSIAWIIHTEVQVLAADLFSNNVAAFCKDQNLIIFNPCSPNPVCSFKNVSETPVTSAVFVPLKSMVEEDSICFHENSQLFFCNENQNLFALSETNEDDKASLSDGKNVIPNAAETPFGMLQAEYRKSDVQRIESQQFNISNQEEKTFICNPLLQNPIALCSVILPSLLKPIEKNNNDDFQDKQKDQKKKRYNKSFLVAVDELDLNKIKNKIFDFSFLQQTVSFSASVK